jgi:hypothetical protein
MLVIISILQFKTLERIYNTPDYSSYSRISLNFSSPPLKISPVILIGTDDIFNGGLPLMKRGAPESMGDVPESLVALPQMKRGLPLIIKYFPFSFGGVPEQEYQMIFSSGDDTLLEILLIINTIVKYQN